MGKVQSFLASGVLAGQVAVIVKRIRGLLFRQTPSLLPAFRRRQSANRLIKLAVSPLWCRWLVIFLEDSPELKVR